MKEKKQVEIQNPVFALNAIGRPTAKGTCPSCGGKVFAILGKDNTPPDLKAKAEAWKKTHAGHKKGGKSRSRSKSKGKHSKGSRKSKRHSRH